MRKQAPSPRLRLPERWKHAVATCVLGLLGVCCCLADAAPPAHVAETYTSDYEKAPHPNFVDQESTAQWARTEQDRYRLRVHLPDSSTPDEKSSSRPGRGR